MQNKNKKKLCFFTVIVLRNDIQFKLNDLLFEGAYKFEVSLHKFFSFLVNFLFFKFAGAIGRLSVLYRDYCALCSAGVRVSVGACFHIAANCVFIVSVSNLSVCDQSVLNTYKYYLCAYFKSHS